MLTEKGTAIKAQVIIWKNTLLHVTAKEGYGAVVKPLFGKEVDGRFGRRYGISQKKCSTRTVKLRLVMVGLLAVFWIIYPAEGWLNAARRGDENLARATLRHNR